MSFNTTPKSGPTITTPQGVSARDRAIEAFKAAQQTSTAQETPVQNPNNIKAEELSAIKASSEKTEEKIEQQDTNEDSKASEDTKAKDTHLSPQYAQLARKERALRAQAQELKAKEDAFKAREEAIKAKEAEYQANYIHKDKFKTNGLDALAEAGLSYDQLTDLILNSANRAEESPQDSAFKALQAEIKAIKDAQEAARRSYEEQQKAQYEQAVTQIRNETQQLVEDNPEFEAIKATNSIDDVVELIERTFHQTGKILAVEDAAREIEAYLAEEAYKLAQLKKIQSRLKPVENKQEVKEVKKDEQKQNSMKTLTNAVGASRPMTARERAIAAFKNSKA